MRKAQYSIDFIKQISEDRGGRCLSSEYGSDNEKLKFQCSKGHTWMATPIVVLQGGWCPQCAKENDNLQKLEILKQIAKERGGECLSDTYINSITKLLFRCSEGHKWETTPKCIKQQKTWCVICKGMAKHTIEEMKQFAEGKGGKCLSEIYINAHSKLIWQCKEGHRWEAKPNCVISDNTWCVQCAGLTKLTIEQMHKIAEKKGGKCLSSEYINTNTKLKWQCKEGHQWEAAPTNIKNQGQWCPACAGRIKHTIEEMHEIAKKNQGKCLDSEYINVHHKLKWQCDKGHIWEATPKSILNSHSWCPYCNGSVKQTIAEMQLMANKYGGKCLSSEYINANTKLLWQCKEGHQWETTPSSIKIGNTWCPVCAGKEKLTIEFMKDLAIKRGGVCLSDVYINVMNNLLWQCKEGHQWEASASSIKNGNTWCPYCGGRMKHTIEKMQNIAENNGGKCLSKEYINAKTKLLWQCKEGHQWEAKPAAVINLHSWCPYCYGKKRHTIEQMHQLAKIRGGKCLSKVYLGANNKLLWECSEGHKWKATPSIIKNNNSWCLICNKQNRKNK